MAKIVTLGEIMLRLSPPGYQRFAQASDFEINYGGAEANVAASLAQFGNDAAFVSKVPANAIGDAAVATLRKRRQSPWNLFPGKWCFRPSVKRCL